MNPLRINNRLNLNQILNGKSAEQRVKELLDNGQMSQQQFNQLQQQAQLIKQLINK